MRIAHCSDLHLLSLSGARFLDFANKRWIGGLNLLVSRGRHHQPGIFAAMVRDINAERVDHVICTGDVTNLGLAQEFRFARSFFDQFAIGPEQVTVIPGNHDAYVADGAGHFSEHFAPHFASDAGWEWDDGDPWPVVRIRGQTAIVGLSTSHETPWFTCFGVLGHKQLERLGQVLGDPRLAGRFRIVAIHHPPAGSRSESPVRGLRDRKLFAEVLARHGAELVLHGHEHRDLYAELAGAGGVQVPVRGIQSGTYHATRPELLARYRIYELTPEGVLSGEILRVWSPEQGSFAVERSPSGAALAPDLAAV
jgi:3',5'-cyclic AMP phosphodiesterase CpdA